jgi:O-antigen/teichoic acid export membrane protein
MTGGGQGGDAGDSMLALVRRGVSWKLVSQVVVQVARVVFALVVARLLTPEDFGLAAMALVVAGFVIAFSDLGLGAALIQRRSIDELDRSTVFWSGLVVGVLLTLAGIALAAPISAFYGEPAVEGLMAALSVCFLISAMSATQRALLSREMDFRRLELSAMAGVIVGGLVSVAGAVSGWGPWALIAQQIVTVVVTTTVLWFATSWRPKFAFSIDSLRTLGGYGVHVLGTRLVYRAQESALPLVIGRFLGAAPLGIFTIAYTIILVPLTRLAIPIGEVLFPAFSRMQDERERVAHFWIRALEVLAAICTPAMVGLAIVAADFVEVVLGDQWSDAVPVIQILAWVGLIQALQAWNGGILMGLGRSRTLFRATLSFFVVYLASFLIGVQWGIVGVAVTYAVVATVLEVAYLWLTTHALGISFWRPVRALSGVAQASALMGILVAALQAVLTEHGLPPALRLPILVLAGVLVYLPLLTWRAPDVLSSLRTLRRREEPGAAGAPASL